MSDEEKTRYGDMINELGGTVSDTITFDPLTTHVVSAKLSRSERHLAAIANGKWLLVEAFLEDSIKNGTFMEVSVDCLRVMFLFMLIIYDVHVDHP